MLFMTIGSSDLWRYVGKDNASGRQAVVCGGLSDVGFPHSRETQQPQHTVGDLHNMELKVMETYFVCTLSGFGMFF
jgi:hypothetical protein